jgi:hypothetical protein
MTATLARTRATLDRSALADGEPMTFVASTQDTNRYGFSLRNEGWLLDAYNGNPVVLWMHDPWTPPVARGLARSDGERLLLGNVVFDAEDELARTVESKLRRGFLNSVSVGWDWRDGEGRPILEWWRLSPDQMRDEAYYDLAEVSVVTVPGDPGALRMTQALAPLGARLLRLVEERERGDAAAEDLVAAVREELTRLGIDPAALAAPPTPAPPPDPDVPAPPPGVDLTAARALCAVLELPKGENE